MHRTPNLKDQAKLIRQMFAEMGATLTHAESLERAARLNGYADWNAAAAAIKATASRPPEVLAPTKRTARVWLITHHHRHGQDVLHLVQDEKPSTEEAIALIDDAGGGYEPQLGEFFETNFVDLSLPLEPSPNAATRMLEVDMTEHFDYVAPEEVPEWAWIERHGAFAHRGNGTEGGVWEFLVHVQVASQDEQDPVPASLAVHFERARQAQAAWVLFHQG